MADLAGVFQVVSCASSLALELYRLVAIAPSGVRDTTSAISSFSSTVKQVGTIIREDDSLPSLEAIETLGDVLDQGNTLLKQIKSSFPVEFNCDDGQYESYDQNSIQGAQPGATAMAGLSYLIAHLDSLRLTLAVMIQTMHTAQSIIWARTRPAISPQQAAAAIANEKTQLEILIIEQQISILSASKLYDPSRFDTRLLMEHDCSQSLVSIEHVNTAVIPANLFRYQERFIASLDTSDATEKDWFPAVCGISKSHLEHLLERWTRLRQLQEKINDEERIAYAQRRETQQPTVESDVEDEIGALPKFRSNTARLNTPTPLHPVSAQPQFTKSTPLPIPVPDSRFGPTAPLSPVSLYGVSPKTSGTALPMTHLPVSPRSSLSMPVEAAAAVEAKEDDDDVDLEIPWRLCTRQHYWDYIDKNIIKTNSDLPPPNPSTDRKGWTEILASWVCKEAIKEAGFDFTKVQKDSLDGRRTRFETCFVIQQALSFDQVERLVERTVEIYRQNKPPSPPLPPPPPPPPQRRTSLDRPRPSQRQSFDGDRASLTNKQQLPPPPLDRSYSMPGPPPSYPPRPAMNEHPTTLHLPLLTSTYPTLVPPYSPSFYSPPNVSPLGPPPQMPLDPRRQNTIPGPFDPPSPLVQSPSLSTWRPSNFKARFEDVKGTRHDQHYSSASTASDDEHAARGKHRSRVRRPSSSRKMKHSTVGTLAKVGGLAALLDGIVDLGVL